MVPPWPTQGQPEQNRTFNGNDAEENDYHISAEAS